MKGFIREFKRINWRKTLFGSFKRTAISLVLFIPVLVFAASIGYQYYIQQMPAIIYQHKLQTMTDNVKKSMSLPTDEQPVVATVTDKNLLPKEKFFSFAQDGDKILMYKKHKLAILYRPASATVVTQATLDFTDVSPTPVAAVAGASTSASTSTVQVVGVTIVPVATPITTPEPTQVYHPQGKVLVQPQ